MVVTLNQLPPPSLALESPLPLFPSPGLSGSGVLTSTLLWTARAPVLRAIQKPHSTPSTCPGWHLTRRRKYLSVPLGWQNWQEKENVPRGKRCGRLSGFYAPPFMSHLTVWTPASVTGSSFHVPHFSVPRPPHLLFLLREMPFHPEHLPFFMQSGALTHP